MTDLVCASGVELLMEYLEGTLAPDVRADLEAHVAAFYRFPSVRSFAAHLADPDQPADLPGAATRGALRRARLSRA